MVGWGTGLGKAEVVADRGRAGQLGRELQTAGATALKRGKKKDIRFGIS